MKNIILILLFLSTFIPCVFADNENYFRQDLSGHSFRFKSLIGANFNWANLTDANFNRANLTNAIFARANLTDANFTDAILTNADFSHANLTGTDFSDATLTNANLTDAVITGANFNSMYLSNEQKKSGFTKEQLYSTANYKNKDLTGVDLGFVDLSGGDFSLQNLTNANFGYANLTGANFSYATLTDVNFNSVNLTDANFPSAKFTNMSFTGVNLTGADFFSATFTNADFTDTVITGADFGNSKGFTKEQLYSTASYKNKDLSGVTLDVIDLSGCDFSLQTLTNAYFRSANLTDADFTSATLSNANFSSSNLTNVNFTNANLTGSNFSSSNLADANFEGANLTNVNFSKTQNFTIPQNAIFNYTVMPDGSIRTDSVIIETSLPTSLILFENTKYNLEVSASEKDGKKLTYTWYVDKNNGKGFVKAGTKSTLAITPKANMVGWQYYCTVSNGSETRNTSVSKITAVRTPVKITSKPKALNTFEGAENAGFSVSATGYDVKYQWQAYKVVGYNAKGKPIYDWVDIAGATSANYKPESDFENNGLKYRCKVYNDGSAAYTSGVKLTVNEAAKIGGITIYQKPETAKQAHLVASEENAAEYFDITLTANASGYKVKYQWYLNGEKIEKATGKTLSIKKPQIGEYAYSCKVYNEASKNVVATEDMASFVLVISALKFPIDLMGQTLYFEDENGSLESSFYFAATSKSSCILINPNTYDEDWFDEGDKWGDEFKINFYDSSSYSYKRNNDENASLKLTFTKNVYLTKNYYDDYDESYESEKIKLSSVKTVLQGTLSAFDENGYAVFKTNDGKIYNVSRVSSEGSLPESISGKVFMGFFYAKDKKNCYLVDYDYDEDKYIINENFGKGTYTYKKISSNVVKYTLNFAKGKCDVYLIGTNEWYFYRKTGTENKKPIFSVGQGFSDFPLISDFM